MKLIVTLFFVISMFCGVWLALPVQAQQPSPTGVQANNPAGKEPAGVKVLRGLVYAQVNEKSLLLDLYLPEKAQRPLPLIIWVHGGAWLSGDKANCQARRMIERGYAVASINYRLSSEAIFPAQIEDCKATVRWLRADAKQYDLDPDHFGAGAIRPADIWWRFWALAAM